jgi:hypothetical protein
LLQRIGRRLTIDEINYWNLNCVTIVAVVKFYRLIDRSDPSKKKIKMHNKKRKSEEDANIEPQEKKIKVNETTVFPQEIWIEVFTFIPYKQLICNCSLVNHHFQDVIISGEESVYFWSLICKNQMISFYVEYIKELSEIEGFVTKCKPTSIEMNISTHLLKRSSSYRMKIVGFIKLIEPFVTILYADNYRSFYKVIGYYYDQVERKIFPKLERCNGTFDFEQLEAWFGKDLSRFKQLGIEGVKTHDFQFGSLEKVTLNCEALETDILKQNLQTIHDVGISNYEDDKTKLACLASVAQSLIIRIRSISEPVVFSKLTSLKLHAKPDHIMTFFSVTHPLLIKVHVTEEVGEIEKICDLAVQPSVRSLRCEGQIVINALLKVMKSESLKELFISFNDITKAPVIDLSGFCNLKSLTLGFDPAVYCENFSSVLQTNSLTSLELIKDCDLKPLLPYLSNLQCLHLYKVDKDTLVGIMKLPNLVSLKVFTMALSYSQFTQLTMEPSNITDYDICLFSCSTVPGKEPIYIINNLERLDILNPQFVFEHKQCSEIWILLAASTMNIDRVDLSFILDGFMEECFSHSPFPSKDLFTLVQIVIETLKNALNTVIEENYLSMNENEKKMVLNMFETMFQMDQIQNMNKIHPAMKSLLTEIRDYVVQENETDESGEE